MLDFIKKRYDQKTARAVDVFFKNVNLPLPASLSEYSQTCDDGILVFLNSEACVIRLTNDHKHPNVKHPLVLQPIFSRHCGQLRADVFHGVETPVSAEDMKKLQNVLNRDGFWIDYANRRNAGYVITDSGQKEPVYIDMGGINKLTPNYINTSGINKLHDVIVESKILLKNILNKTAQLLKPIRSDKKEEVSAPEYLTALQNGFKEAWPKDKDRADKHKINDAWKLCIKTKEKGMLINSWQNAGSFKNIAGASNAYAKFREEPGIS